MRSLFTTVVITDSLKQLCSGELGCWFNHRPLAMPLMGFEAIEPRAFRRKLTHEDSYPLSFSCLSIVPPYPIPHRLREMPTGIVPHQQHCFLPFLLQLLTHPAQTPAGERSHGPALDEAQPELFRICPQYPVTCQCLGVGVGFVGVQL